jgi:hypothetical protein
MNLCLCLRHQSIPSLVLCIVVYIFSCFSIKERRERERDKRLEVRWWVVLTLSSKTRRLLSGKKRTIQTVWSEISTGCPSSSFYLLWVHCVHFYIYRTCVLLTYFFWVLSFKKRKTIAKTESSSKNYRCDSVSARFNFISWIGPRPSFSLLFFKNTCR